MRSNDKEDKNVVLNNLILYAGLLLLILLSYWRRVTLLDDSFSYDQGIHLILARLWAAGYKPYEEIFVSYPPLFIWSLGVPWKLFNQPGALQLVMSAYALAGVVALVYLGWVYHSRLAGLTAGVLLSFTPAYFDRSITIMGEVPSIGVAVAAVGLAEKYRRSGGWVWLALAGVALAASLSLKLLPFYAPPFVGLVLLSRHVEISSWTNFLSRLQRSQWLLGRDLFILGFSFLVAFLLPVIFFDPVALYEQVVGMRLVSREAQLNVFRSNNRDMINFIFNNSGLAVLAIYGLIFVVARKLKHYWLLLAWFSLIWGSLYFHVPLRAKHLPILLPVLAIFSGFAIAHIFNILSFFRKERWSLQSLSMALVLVMALTIFSWDLTNAVSDDTPPSFEGVESDEDEEGVARNREALEFINKIAAPTDCVIADNPVFLYYTQRLPPPELSEVSQTRIETGYLTLKDIVQSIETHRCHVVAALTPRFNQEIPGLSEWLANNYLGLYRRGEISLYFAKIGPGRNYTSLPDYSFGGMVELYGVHFNEQPWVRGKTAYISLFWRLQRPLQNNYLEKITLRSPAHGAQVYQMMRLPFEGQFEPASWRVANQARDTFWLSLPTDLPAGTYDLKFSLCKPETGQCLPVDNHPAQTEVLLGQITVAPL